MTKAKSFETRMNGKLECLSPAERRVARFFHENREEVLIASASSLAEKAGASDATVVRTAKALGYSGMDDMRRQIADELRQHLTPATRLMRTLGNTGDTPGSVLATTFDIHLNAIRNLREGLDTGLFQSVVERIVTARRIIVFGIGPSSALAEYFVIQLGRFGLMAQSLTHTGLLLADGLLNLRTDDLVIIMAYSRVYRELAALLEHARRLDVPTVLLTDSLGPALQSRVSVVIPVARGRVDAFSMHTATFAFLEALLVGVAAQRPAETLSSLMSLNDLRAIVTGEAVDLPIPSGAAGKRHTPPTGWRQTKRKPLSNSRRSRR